jgi:hypothetical protein
LGNAVIYQTNFHQLSIGASTRLPSGKTPPLTKTPSRVDAFKPRVGGPFIQSDYNHSREFPYIGVDMRVPISYKGDRVHSEQIFLDAVNRHAAEIANLAEPELNRLKQQFFIDDSTIKPLLAHHRQLGQPRHLHGLEARNRHCLGHYEVGIPPKSCAA